METWRRWVLVNVLVLFPALVRAEPLSIHQNVYDLQIHESLVAKAPETFVLESLTVKYDELTWSEGLKLKIFQHQQSHEIHHSFKSFETRIEMKLRAFQSEQKYYFIVTRSNGTAMSGEMVEVKFLLGNWSAYRRGDDVVLHAVERQHFNAEIAEDLSLSFLRFVERKLDGVTSSVMPLAVSWSLHPNDEATFYSITNGGKNLNVVSQIPQIHTVITPLTPKPRASPTITKLDTI